VSKSSSESAIDLSRSSSVEGRAKRGGFKANLAPEPFVEAVMKGFEHDTFEIAYGTTERMLKGSHAELELAFAQMNSRM
jgi:hypothetical protein